MEPPLQRTLYYVHDPMCSWCWGFNPTWQALLSQLPNDINVISLLGGLAADSDQPMPIEMQASIRSIWKQIQQRIPSTPFNFDFWEQCHPRRSTYPACRAIIAARKQNSSLEQAMTLAIQEAYYLNAQNPSDDETLIHLAQTLALDTKQFIEDLQSKETQGQLLNEIHLSQSLGARGFPSLVLAVNNQHTSVAIDYHHAEVMLKQILSISLD